MEIEYHNKKIEKTIKDTQTLTETIGFEMARMVKKREKQIEATTDFQELIKNNLGHPHPLKGDLKEYFGIGITGNYRLVVKSKDNKIIIVRGVIDYHGDKYNWIIP